MVQKVVLLKIAFKVSRPIAAVGEPVVERSSMTRIVFENVAGAILCMSNNSKQIWIGCRNGDVQVFSLKDLRAEKHGNRKVLPICSLCAF